jgi:NAD(P)H-nitrite reductase large subunit
VFSDTRRGAYRKLVISGERLTGAVLVGDVSDARRLSELLRSGEPVPDDLLSPGNDTGGNQASEDPSDLICSCNSVSRGTIEDAIRRGGLTSLAQVGAATRAATGCGSCGSEVEALLTRSSARNMDEMRAKRTRANMGA